MASVLDGATGLLTTYEYDPAGRVTVQYHPNAATTYFSYDLAGRLSQKVTEKNGDGSVLVRFAYTRDAAGNPIAIEREPALGVFYYEYDVLQRLAYEGQFISAVRQYENYYEFDAAGNRTLLRHGETSADNLTYYSYNAANELTDLHDASGWTYFAYDASGNTIMEQTPAYTRYFGCYEARGQGRGSLIHSFAGRGSACYSCSGHRLTSATRAEAAGTKLRRVLLGAWAREGRRPGGHRRSSVLWPGRPNPAPLHQSLKVV